jgi:deoxyadenosine/deoxycytidine kinase
MYIIEGNIGTGKSTFLQEIKQYLPYTNISLESLQNWQKTEFGKSILQNFYEDTKRWAYSMEITALTNRIPEHLKHQSTPGINIVERSIYSGFYCFANNGFDEGFLQPVEWNIYKTWFDFIVKRCNQPYGFIYLKAEPEISYKRILKRNRIDENII